MALEAAYVDIEDLVPLPGNPKDHDQGGIGQAVNEYGYLERVIVNRTTGHLISGHGRREDLLRRKTHGESPPDNVLVQDGRWLVPADYTELPADKEMGAALALNRLTELGGWNEPLLFSALSDLMAQGEEMLRGTGFEPEDLDELAKTLFPEEKEEGEREGGQQAETAFGRADQLQEKWQVQEGDLWRCGEHYIICGDCRELHVWERLVKAAGIPAANGVFTSPPYAEQRKKQYGGVPADAYVNWWENVQANSRRLLAADGSFFVNIKPHSESGERSLYVIDLVAAMVRRWDWHLIDEYCWLRPGMPGEPRFKFRNAFEPIYHFAINVRDFKFLPDNVTVDSDAVPVKEDPTTRGGGPLSELQGRQSWIFGDERYASGKAYPSNVIKAFTNDRVRGQEAAFPVQLPAFFIQAYSAPGDAWVDPFCGSGTLIHAAQENERIGLGIEIQPKYVAVILERCAEELELAPVKVS
jgi:site-specific DNA-methyltransferase (adenine-specific)